MPYIEQKDRQKIYKGDDVPDNKGELNFLISCALIHYMHKHGKSYQVLSDCISACNDAGEEFRRRVLNPYEDEKIEENGDIYYG